MAVCEGIGALPWGAGIMHGRDAFADAAQKRQQKGMYKALGLIFLIGLISSLLKRGAAAAPNVWYDRSMFKQFRYDMLRINPTYRDPTPEFRRKFLDLWMDQRMGRGEAELRAATATAMYFESFGAKMPDWFMQHLHDCANSEYSKNYVERQNMIPRMRSKREKDILDRFWDLTAGLRNIDFDGLMPEEDIDRANSRLKDEVTKIAGTAYFQDVRADVFGWADAWFSKGMISNIFPQTLYIHHFSYYVWRHKKAPTQPFFPLSPAPNISRWFPNPWQ